MCVDHTPSLPPALLIYDWVITLGQETRYVWHSKFRGYTALFFLNRINMAGMIIGILLGLTPWHTGEVCPPSISYQHRAHPLAEVSDRRFTDLSGRSFPTSCESAVLVLASFQIMNFFIWASTFNPAHPSLSLSSTRPSFSRVIIASVRYQQPWPWLCARHPGPRLGPGRHEPGESLLP